MSIESDEFEKQVKRIYDVLVRDRALVTWNDKIPDPDNSKQLRQIDITIERNGELTHIECRNHKVPQDTKWIEELYGRKISLKASAMIAVSSSGFTEGATKKAKRLGVFIYNLTRLTDFEIRSWGNRTYVTWYYYRFENLEVCHYLKSIKGLNPKEIEQCIYSKPEYYSKLFNLIKIEFNKDSDFIFPYGFRFGQILCDNFEILGRKVISMSVRGDVYKVPFRYSCPYVMSYHLPNQPFSSIASIEKTKRSGLEIIKSTSGFASVDLDLSIAPQAPINSVLAGIFEFSELPGSKDHSPKFNIIGSHEQRVVLDKAQFIVAEIKDN